MGNPSVQDLHKPTGSNVLAVLCNLTGVATAFASLASGWPTAHAAWTVFMILWLAYFQHTWMTIFHADAHYAAYEGKWHNIRQGMIVGTLLMVPFHVYRHLHIRHHSKMGLPDDFEMWPYCDPSKSLAFRRFFVLCDLLLGWWLGPYIYGRIFFVRNSPISDPKVRRRIRWEYLLIVTCWSGIIALVAYYGAWMLL